MTGLNAEKKGCAKPQISTPKQTSQLLPDQSSNMPHLPILNITRVSKEEFAARLVASSYEEFKKAADKYTAPKIEASLKSIESLIESGKMETAFRKAGLIK